jgi:hypothetical protein
LLPSFFSPKFDCCKQSLQWLLNASRNMFDNFRSAHFFAFFWGWFCGMVRTSPLCYMGCGARKSRVIINVVVCVEAEVHQVFVARGWFKNMSVSSWVGLRRALSELASAAEIFNRCYHQYFFYSTKQRNQLDAECIKPLPYSTRDKHVPKLKIYPSVNICEERYAQKSEWPVQKWV